MNIRPRLVRDEYVYTLPRGVTDVTANGYAPWHALGTRRVIVRINRAAPDADKWQFEVNRGRVTLKPPASFEPAHDEHVTVELPPGVRLHQRY